MKKIAPLIIVGLAIAAYFIFAESGFRKAPALEMTSLENSTINTAKRNNKPLLMTFWATTCSSCVKEMPHFIEMQNKMADKVDIVGVSMYYDNIEHVKEMIKRRGINYHIVTDTDGTIGEAFGGIRLTPTSFLISPSGEIVFQKIGDIDFHQLEKDIATFNKAS